MKNNIYYYPAIFTPEDTGYTVSFPDFPGCYTQADTLEEAYQYAADAIGLYAQNEKGDFDLPDATFHDVDILESGEFFALVAFNKTEYLKRNSTKAVKKTLTIPSWLNELAEKEKINFSNTLQIALMEKLNLS
ncbi:MAG: type II toxin-antitoxin system HicB family antitoxin [Clostridia bacterium]|nr:type II toxin-antitoxin system HicB family antitoxin [Clostridia bacterium]